MQLQQKYRLVLTICRFVCFGYPLVPRQFLKSCQSAGYPDWSATASAPTPRDLRRASWVLVFAFCQTRYFGVIRSGALTMGGRWNPTANMDAKPFVVILWDIQWSCLVCARKGPWRDDSVAFKDVFWPCGTALHATIKFEGEESKTSLRGQCIEQRELLWSGRRCQYPTGPRFPLRSCLGWCCLDKE